MYMAVAEGGGYTILPERETDSKLIQAFRALGVEIEGKSQLYNRFKILDTRQVSEGSRKKERDGHLSHTLNVEMILNKVSHLFSEINGLEDKIRLAGLFHDIGKTGGVDFSIKAQTATMRLFSLFDEQPHCAVAGRSLPSLTVATALEQHLPQEKNKILQDLEGTGWTQDTLMSEVYKSHVKHTTDILENNGVDEEVIFLCGNHHRLNNKYNYYSPATDKRNIDNARLDKLSCAAVLLEIMDFYEAAVIRGKMTHSQVVELLQKNFTNKNVEAAKIIETIKDIPLL